MTRIKWMCTCTLSNMEHVNCYSSFFNFIISSLSSNRASLPSPLTCHWQQPFTNRTKRHTHLFLMVKMWSFSKWVEWGIHVCVFLCGSRLLRNTSNVHAFIRSPCHPVCFPRKLKSLVYVMPEWSSLLKFWFF